MQKPPTPGRKFMGLPAYTKPQFQQVRPGGNYQSYLNYLTRARGGRQPTNQQTTARRVTPGAAPTTYGGMFGKLMIETPEQLQKRAIDMSNASMEWQRKWLNEESDRARIQ